MTVPPGSDLVDALGELGLPRTEARVYLALLDAAESTAAELAQRAGVARPKVYEAVARLEERGVCHSLARSTTAFRAEPPMVALPLLQRAREVERQHRAQRESAVVEQLAARLPEPPRGPEPARPFDFLEAVLGRARTSGTFERLIDTATHEVALMQQPPFIQPRARRNASELAALRRGVRIRLIFSTDSLDEPDRCEPLARAGAEVRIAQTIPMKLLVRDGSEAMVSLRDPYTHEQSTTSMVVRHPDLVSPFMLMFDEQWAAARPLDA